jgi:4-alpha-glucanotransferase
MIDRRGSGLLLHITSLPSRFGIGDLGPEAYRFADFLNETKQSYWQVLPLNPTDSAFGNSPYSSNSAFAGNTLLISPELMIEVGLLRPEEIAGIPVFPAAHCDFQRVIDYKESLFDQAFNRYLESKEAQENCAGFAALNAYWLDDFALFTVLKRYYHGQIWSNWPAAVRDRQPETLHRLQAEFKTEIAKEIFLQYLFNKQWHQLRAYCKAKGIKLIGDIPIYVSFDSVDVWQNSEYFKLDDDKKPTHVAGVPPDYFSQTGQLWGNPVYRWEKLKEEGYSWWLQRIEHNLTLFDLIRIDHFRGFVGFWEVPAGEKTAVNGKWVHAPAVDFFHTAQKRFAALPIIAEDLGVITQEVKDIMKHFGFPGMKILHFAFGEDLEKHPYLPHNYAHNSVVYTGTHDNNTTKGWFLNELNGTDKKRLFEYLGYEVSEDEINWALIYLAFNSPANTALIPAQDILGLGEEGRMNLPSKTHDNWQWRLGSEQLTTAIANRLREATIASRR